MPAKYVKGFASLDTETDVASLPVEGTFPDWLTGTLVRNGPALYDMNGKSFRHWFDGQAMLHRFDIGGGGVSYRNRFLNTPAARAVREQGRISYLEFATDPCGSIFSRYKAKWQHKVTQNAGVNVAAFGDHAIAMTESPMAVEFDPKTLDTIGLTRWADDLGGGPTTAHPHIDPTTGEPVNFLLTFGRTSVYRVHRVRTESKESVPLGAYRTDLPGYIHSFAITQRYVVLVVYPFVVNPLSLLLRDRPFIENFRWRPEQGTRIVLMDLAGGGITGVYKTDPFFAFHHINAYDDADSVVLDISAYDDPTVVDAFYLNRMRGAVPAPQPFPVRYRVHTTTGHVESSRLADQSFELPRINYENHNGRPYRYAYGNGALDPTGTNFLDQLVKLDTTTGETTVWQEEGCYPGEPVFVQSPEEPGEDRGVILSVVLDGRAARSWLLVLDATDFTELARATVPHAIPFGFHGQFRQQW
jgi:beta,beta-carotene 9',10'-dioxygenase